LQSCCHILIKIKTPHPLKDEKLFSYYHLCALAVSKALLKKYRPVKADTSLSYNGKGSGNAYHPARLEFSMQLQGELQHGLCTGFPAIPDSLLQKHHLYFSFS